MAVPIQIQLISYLKVTVIPPGIFIVYNVPNYLIFQ